MKKLTATLCLTIAVLLGSVGVSVSAERALNFRYHTVYECGEKNLDSIRP